MQIVDRFKYLLIFAVSALLFVPFLGNVHLFDWDEINFAECAREMLVSKDYIRTQIDFMPFWEKPPLFIWMQVVSMKAFGINAFAARLPNALIGIATCLTLFSVGKKIKGAAFGLIWTILYAASWLPHLYFKSGIIDPTFNFFIFLSFYAFHKVCTSPRKWFFAALAGLCLGLAVLTKGPVAILVSGIALVVYAVVGRGGKKLPLPLPYLPVILVFALLPFAAWMAAAVVQFGADYAKWFLTEFVTYQIRLFRTEDSDHGGPFYYHFVVLLLGCFPASPLLFQFVGKKKDGDNTGTAFTILMWILFWTVLILFSIVKTKIVHYSSLCYFPLTYLAALKAYALWEKQEQLKKGTRIALYSIGGIWAVLITALPLVGMFKRLLIPLIDDPFAVGNLGANIAWSYAECVPGALYAAALTVGLYWMRNEMKKGIITLAFAQILTIQFTILHFTPKIEGYSQRAAIAFYEQFKGKAVYVQPVGFKSYANLFYTEKQPATNHNYYVLGKTDADGKAVQPHADQDWLMHGTVDRPTYFICKIQNVKDLDSQPGIIRIGVEYGFVFYVRGRTFTESQLGLVPTK